MGNALALALAVLVLAGPACADLVSATRIGESTAAPPLELDLADQFGSSVAFVGDVDGDGIDDIAVGAPFDDAGGPDRGAVWILFLAADGAVREGHRLGSTTPALAGLIGDWDRFGASLAALGDVNGDGIPDLAVGAPRADAGGADRGVIWILHLDAGGGVAAYRRVDGDDLAAGLDGDGPAAGLDDGDRLGAALTVVGDLDGDGGFDLAALAAGDDDGAANAGAVWIVRFAADGTVAGTTKISSASAGAGAVFAAGSAARAGLAAPGDLDGDGVPDLLVGSSVVYLAATGADLGYQEITLPPGDLEPDDRFGASVAAGFDLDGDGIGDLVVGAPGDDDGDGGAGAVWVVLLDSGAGVRERHKISATRGGLADGPGFGDQLGASLAVRAAVGGHAIAVGATGDDDGALNAGSVRLLRVDSVWTQGPISTVSSTSTTISIWRSSTSSTLGSTTSSTWPPTTTTLPATTTTLAAPSTTTTTVAVAVMCGDATGDGRLTATDALSALRAAVGLTACPFCVCDVDAGGLISVVDALGILAASTSPTGADLTCPPCS